MLKNNMNHFWQTNLQKTELHQITKRIRSSSESLIDIQNIFDNEFFELCLKGYLHSADDDPARMGKVNKMLQS